MTVLVDNAQFASVYSQYSLRGICLSGDNYFRGKFFSEFIIFQGQFSSGAIVRGAIFLGGNYPPGQLPVGQVSGWQSSKGKLSRGQLSGEQFSPRAIVRTPSYIQSIRLLFVSFNLCQRPFFNKVAGTVHVHPLKLNIYTLTPISFKQFVFSKLNVTCNYQKSVMEG